MSHLIIVNSEKGDLRFWQRLPEVESIPPAVGLASEWTVALQNLRIEIGRTEDLEVVRERDPQKVAAEMKRGGLAQRSADLLKRASHFFRMSNETRESNDCLSWALRFEGQFAESGRKFQRTFTSNILR
jgi:hypothetical protein